MCVSCNVCNASIVLQLAKQLTKQKTSWKSSKPTKVSFFFTKLLKKFNMHLISILTTVYLVQYYF